MKETVMHLIVASYTVGQHPFVLLQYHWWNYSNYIQITSMLSKQFIKTLSVCPPNISPKV